MGTSGRAEDDEENAEETADQGDGARAIDRLCAVGGSEAVVVQRRDGEVGDCGV